MCIGYGDITAQNSDEKWASILVIVVGSIMTAYLIGSLTSLLFEGDKDYQWKENKIEEAYMFCEHYRLSNALVREITQHINYDCHENYVAADPVQFLDSLYVSSLFQ